MCHSNQGGNLGHDIACPVNLTSFKPTGFVIRYIEKGGGTRKWLDMPQNNPQTQRNQKLKNKIKESCIPIKKRKKVNTKICPIL
jgi:hypothetical protein